MTDEELFQPIQSARVSDNAADQILNLIAEGRLKPGNRLPSERELVRQLEVSRASVHEALRASQRHHRGQAWLGVLRSRKW